MKTIQNKSKIKILDSLFRDGMQGAEMKTSLSNAVEIVRKMDQLGFDYVELGFAGANQFTSDLVRCVNELKLRKIKPVVFARTRKPGELITQNADIKELLRLRVPVATIVAKSRLLDVKKSLQTTGQENLKMIVDTIIFLKKQGLEVILDLEHAVDAWMGRGVFGQSLSENQSYKNREYFKSVVRAGLEAGADCLVVCDTNGGSSPQEIKDLFNFLTIKYPKNEFGIHCHNDNGLAIANTRQAVLSGAKQIQGVSGGFGERCGNADLLSIVARLTIKDKIKILNKNSLASFKDFYEQICQSFSRNFVNNSPFVGRDAFGTYAGMHASSEMRSDGAYLQCNPNLVGNCKRIGVNFQSGRANIAFLAKEMGFNLNNEQLSLFAKEYVDEIEYGAFEISREAFWLACYLLKEKGCFFEVLDYQAGIKKNKQQLSGWAKIEIKIIGKVKKIESKGSGAFDALWQSLFIGLSKDFPKIEKIELANYDLHALEVETQRSGAPVRVLIRFKVKNKSWTGVGISCSSIEAGLKAMINGIRYYLANF